MSFELRFLPSALKEWEKLGATVRTQFKKKLAERLQYPRVEADKLREADLKDCYKIKLRASGYRLVYRIGDGAITVVTVGKRNRSLVYATAGRQARASRPTAEPAGDSASRPIGKAPGKR